MRLRNCLFRCLIVAPMFPPAFIARYGGSGWGAETPAPSSQSFDRMPNEREDREHAQPPSDDLCGGSGSRHRRLASDVAGAISEEKAKALEQSAETAPRRTPVLERGGRRYVAAEALTEEFAIAIKVLPVEGHLVACWRDRCGLVKDFVREGEAILLPVTAVADGGPPS